MDHRTDGSSCTSRMADPRSSLLLSFLEARFSAASEKGRQRPVVAAGSGNGCFSGAHPFAAAFTAVLLAFCMASSGWTRIGLDGMRVTSITVGKVWSDTILAAGTDSGVYYRLGHDAFKQLTSMGSIVMPAGLTHVRSLYMAPTAARLFAGSDSGLYYFRFTSGLPPVWTKIPGFDQSIVAIAGLGDTIFAASPTNIYRSTNGGTVWSCCTLSFIQNRHPVYTSLTFWKRSITAGSEEWFGNAMPWYGVANSPDFGHTWNDISKLPGQAQPLKAVYCLAEYAPMWTSPRRLVAGTSSGIQWVDDLDTGTWGPLTPQLTKAPARHIYVTTYSKSTIAMLFASTDSGIFISDPKTQSGQWLWTSKKRAYGVTSFETSEPKEWFAAVEDGIYRYDGSTSIPVPSERSIAVRYSGAGTRVVFNDRMVMKNRLTVPVMIFSPSGKKLGTVRPGLVLNQAPLGIVIARTGRW